VFSLYRLNYTRFPTLGLKVKVWFIQVPSYWGFGLDRFHGIKKIVQTSSFLGRFFLSSFTGKTFTGLDCIYEYKMQQGGCLTRSRNWSPSQSPGFTPQFFGGIRVAHLFSFLCCFCFVYLCPVCPMLLMSLDCPFLICPSGFSYIYLQD
jgi:hypothetical protein